jgi:hypothetical protein
VVGIFSVQMTSDEKIAAISELLQDHHTAPSTTTK